LHADDEPAWARALSPEGLSAPDAPVLALIAAHPDDEFAGAGSLIPSMGRGWIVHVTDGATRELIDAFAGGIITRAQYAIARNRDALAAIGLAGFPEDRLIMMGLVDQEASLDLAGLARAVCVLLSRLRPGAILTHPFEGGHPDHDATSFAVHAGLALLTRSDGAPAPVILEMACYHAVSGGAVARSRFLKGPEGVERQLEGRELERKQAMMDCFRTQQRALNLFDPKVERFRAAPRYDFTEPPHPGTLLYERYPWGMEGDRFARLASEAMTALDLTSPL